MQPPPCVEKVSFLTPVTIFVASLLKCPMLNLPMPPHEPACDKDDQGSGKPDSPPGATKRQAEYQGWNDEYDQREYCEDDTVLGFRRFRGSVGLWRPSHVSRETVAQRPSAVGAFLQIVGHGLPAVLAWSHLNSSNKPYMDTDTPAS